MTTLTRMLAVTLVTASMLAQSTQKEPSAATTGKVYEWQSQDCLQYQYYLPKSWSARKKGRRAFDKVSKRLW